MPASMSRTCSRQYFSRKPKAKRRRAAAEENAHGGVGRLESLLHVQRLPGTFLLVLRKGDVVVAIAVALRAHIGLARHRAALEVLRQQAIGAADRCVGVIVRTHGADAAIHVDLVADRAVDDDHHRRGTRTRRARRELGGGEREDHRKVFRPRAGHHRVHGDLLDGIFPGGAEFDRLQVADDFVRRVARRLEHGVDALARRQHDR